jgi:hypothetical protein
LKHGRHTAELAEFRRRMRELAADARELMEHVPSPQILTKRS